MQRTFPLFLSLISLCFVSISSAKDRVALLIANSDYGEHPLPEAKTNVEKLAKVLEQSGFIVTVKENIEKDFRRELETFVPTCPNGGVSLVYFCGYGTHFDRKLSRTIEKPDGKKEKEYYYEKASGIWSTKGRDPYLLEEINRIFVSRSHARLNLLILDCGYHYPKAKLEYQGLAEYNIKSWPSGMVCYAAPPNQSLPKGSTSYLADSLVSNLAKGQTLERTMKKVQGAVAKQSGGKQQLWYRFALSKDADAEIIPAKKRNISTNSNPPSAPKPGDEWINNLGMVFCWCPPGKFKMGLPDNSTPYTRDASQVDVEISKGFWISKYEATLGDYSRARYGKDKPLRGPLGFIPFNISNVPLTSISPFGADGFIKNIIKTDKPPKGWTYRLPTEAEWEYACRAGSQTRFHFGDSPAEMHKYANFADAALHNEDSDFYYSQLDSNDKTGRRPAPIGAYLPNAWGIHDMHGNINEIVADRYTHQLPGGRDPKVSLKSDTFVMKGGSWSSTAEYCQSGFRNKAKGKSASGESAHIGSRVVLSEDK